MVEKRAEHQKCQTARVRANTATGRAAHRAPNCSATTTRWPHGAPTFRRLNYGPASRRQSTNAPTDSPIGKRSKCQTARTPQGRLHKASPINEVNRPRDPQLRKMVGSLDMAPYFGLAPHFGLPPPFPPDALSETTNATRRRTRRLTWRRRTRIFTRHRATARRHFTRPRARRLPWRRRT